MDKIKKGADNLEFSNRVIKDKNWHLSKDLKEMKKQDMEIYGDKKSRENEQNVQTPMDKDLHGVYIRSRSFVSIE